MRHLVLSALVALALAPALAPAQEQGGTQPLRAGTENLSGWLVLDPGSPAGIGLGARFMIPLVPEGLLAGQGLRVREELALEVGADFLHWSYDWRYYDYGGLRWVNDSYSVNALEVVGGVMWNWWLTPRFALYPKLDLGYRIAWISGWNDTWGNHESYSDLFVNGALGAIFKLRKVAVRIEAGNHSLRLGVGVKI
jgi:hypothetical protein